MDRIGRQAYTNITVNNIGKKNFRFFFMSSFIEIIIRNSFYKQSNAKLKIESWMKKYSRGIFSFHWFSNIIITDNGQKTNEKEIEIDR